jgi:hypothetical protein
MSNLIASFAIHWAEAVCEDFETRAGQKLFFMPPKEGHLKNTTTITFYTRDFRFEKEFGVSNEFIEKESSSSQRVADVLIRDFQNKSS